MEFTNEEEQKWGNEDTKAKNGEFAIGRFHNPQQLLPIHNATIEIETITSTCADCVGNGVHSILL